MINSTLQERCKQFCMKWDVEIEYQDATHYTFDFNSIHEQKSKVCPFLCVSDYISDNSKILLKASFKTSGISYDIGGKYYKDEFINDFESLAELVKKEYMK